MDIEELDPEAVWLEYAMTDDNKRIEHFKNSVSINYVLERIQKYMELNYRKVDPKILEKMRELATRMYVTAGHVETEIPENYRFPNKDVDPAETGSDASSESDNSSIVLMYDGETLYQRCSEIPPPPTSSTIRSPEEKLSDQKSSGFSNGDSSASMKNTKSGETMFQVPGETCAPSRKRSSEAILTEVSSASIKKIKFGETFQRRSEIPPPSTSSTIRSPEEKLSHKEDSGVPNSRLDMIQRSRAKKTRIPKTIRQQYYESQQFAHTVYGLLLDLLPKFDISLQYEWILEVMTIVKFPLSLKIVLLDVENLLGLVPVENM